VTKIERVETFILDLPTIRQHVLAMATMKTQSVVIVRVTASDGVVGWGEGATIGGLSYGEESVEGMALAIDTYMTPLLVGQDADRVAAAMTRIDAFVQGNNTAKCAVETALQDGVARRLGVLIRDLCRSMNKPALVVAHHVKDLLPVPPAVAEYSTGLSMGQTAEQMAKSHQISREAQDALAHRSHTLAAQAWADGKLSGEVFTAHVAPYKAPLERDNNIRESSDLASYAKLKPVFDRVHGSVTAANATPLTDGAAAVLLMREGRARELGLEPLGYIRSFAFSAIDVWQDMLMGPSYATPLALDRAGITLSDLTLIDMHEAFAAQTLANLKMFASKEFAQSKLGRDQAIGEVDMDKFNVLGGSLAFGHPFAATGARMITQTLHELRRRGGGLGLNTACAAGGLGVAMVLEVE